MWNNYWSGRSRRDVPQVNYNESSSSEDDDDFNSPLVSPTRPLPTREGSPAELAIPTLNDNVDEDLEAVSRQLSNVGHTHTFRGTRPVRGVRPEPEGNEAGQEQEAQQPSGLAVVSEEEVVEGLVVHVEEEHKLGADDGGGADDNGGGNNMPDDPVDYGAENKADGEKAQEHARHIKVEFEPADIKFWFSQIEGEMLMAAVNSQWLKRTILQRNLPNKQKEDVKAFLELTKTQAGDTIYLDIKKELLRLYAPKPCDSYRKALTRQMVGLPSQLGAQIVDDICRRPSKLNGCCCAGAALALWSLQLPANIRAHISNKEFNHQTYKQVFEAADKVYLSGRQVTVAAVARPVHLDETLPAFSDQNQPQVSAIGKNKNSGSGGGGSGGGGKKNNKNNKGGGKKNKDRGPKSDQNPPDSTCDRHYRHGDRAWYCVAPQTCPWKDRVSSKP